MNVLVLLVRVSLWIKSLIVSTVWSQKTLFLPCFDLKRAQTTTNRFQHILKRGQWTNWAIEMFLLRYSTVVWTLKQSIVHGRDPSNVNCTTIVINFEDF